MRQLGNYVRVRSSTCIGQLNPFLTIPTRLLTLESIFNSSLVSDKAWCPTHTNEHMYSSTYQLNGAPAMLYIPVTYYKNCATNQYVYNNFVLHCNMAIRSFGGEKSDYLLTAILFYWEGRRHYVSCLRRGDSWYFYDGKTNDGLLSEPIANPYSLSIGARARPS